MSADAQPRKRKDKKKKKDERELLSEKVPAGPAPTMTPPATPVPTPSPDEVMHIYKEGKVGGSMFTKLLFFGIMSALAVTISVVVMSSPTRDTAAETSSHEAEAVEPGWSLDLGLGQWSPFSFGADEGREETHADSVGHGEETTSEHHEEEEHDEHSHEDQDEGGIMSWLGWGGASSGDHPVAEEQHSEEQHTEEEHLEEGLGSWFGWGGAEEPATQEHTEETSGSWFGWGSTEPAQEEQATEQPVEQPSDEVVTEPGRKSKNKDKVEELHEEEKEVDQEEQDDKDNEEGNADDVSQEADEPDEDDDDDELATFLRSLDLEPNVKRDSRVRIQQDRAREQRAEQEREERARQEHLREVRAQEERARQERLREIKAREDKARQERLREMRLREEKAREEEEARLERLEHELRVREERAAREERAREERAREERAREERAREERAREERARLEEELEEEDEEKEAGDDEVIAMGRKKSVEVEEDDELFPEAAEALRLEQTSAETREDEGAGVEDKTKDSTEEEAPFSRDEPDEDLAQGVEEKKEVLEPVKEKVVESKMKPAAGSASAKASEFLAERAAERATRETQVPMREQPPINFPPPPSMSPEPSDEEEEEEEEEELSDPELGYSGGEDIIEEEEVEEEEKLGDGEALDSPLGSDVEMNLEGSEPELEDEEEEEEMSEEEVVTPAPLSAKKTPPTSAPSSKERRSGPQVYEHEDITDDYDWAIREELDMADDEFRRNPSGCLHVYQTLQAKHDHSARARVGIAKCLDSLSKEANSNRLLEFAIYAYRRALKLTLKDKLFLETAQTLVARLRFRGFIDQTTEVHNMIISRFKDDAKHRNDLAISYLMINNLKEAERVLKETVEGWPGDAVARAHYGLTLKLQGKHEESIAHLETGLQLDDAATKDARFYFHLGDALVRTGRSHRAQQIYEKGVSLGLFRSEYQRSLYNVDRLTARPWWTLKQTTYTAFFRKLESNWKAIKEEGLRAIQYKRGFLDEAESLRDTGDWKQFELYARGMKNTGNCDRAKVTCQLIGEFEAARGCRRGQAKFSLMEGGTHVWPHCGPTNCRLRAHLGLIVPQGPQIRVANITRCWEEGKVIVFDDSFEHEVWHRGSEPRLVLIVDVWHPELTPAERKSLSPI